MPTRSTLRLTRILPLLALAACNAAPTDADGASAGIRATATIAADNEPAAVRRAVDAGNEGLVRAMVAGDAAAAASFFADDAVLLLPGFPPLDGRAEIEAGFAAAFQSVRYVEILVDSREVQVFGSYALEMGTTRMTYEVGGQRFTDDGKYLVAWTREPGGAWKIHRDASNATGPAR